MSQKQKDIDTILLMLTYCRPAGSRTEQGFINRFLKPLGVEKDAHGNRLITIGKNPEVLWSSHTDSVHLKKGHQEVQFDGKFARLAEGSSSNCLGADDAAGIWIMMEMIKAKVPGLYIFHAAEEIGCVGSRAILTKSRDLLKGIKSAIAFDRRGNNSVITHQGGRCCSDGFAHSLADQLPARFGLDNTGMVTDTKVYMHTIPECTNISVGYYNEHSPEEKLNIPHLLELRDHMVKIDASRFVITRDPKFVEPKTKTFGWSVQPKGPPSTIEDLIWDFPRETAEALTRMGVKFEDVKKNLATDLHIAA